MSAPPIVYIAGPFSGPTPWDVACNVREAERWGLIVAQAGGMPLIPHANTQLFVGQCTEQHWYDGTLELMRRCDGVLVYSRSRDGRFSAGVAAESIEAERLGIPLLDVISDARTRPLEMWLRTLKRRGP